MTVADPPRVASMRSSTSDAVTFLSSNAICAEPTALVMTVRWMTVRWMTNQQTRQAKEVSWANKQLRERVCVKENKRASSAAG